MTGRKAALALLMTGAASLALAQNADRAPVGDLSTIDVTADKVFATVDEHELMFDLYLPHGVDNPPLLVWVHGGAWARGARAPVSTVAFVDAGYAMASIDYRLSGVAPFPAQIHDIKAALRYLRGHANQLGFDATRIGILGTSAGAHLAVLAGVTNGHAELEGTVGHHPDASSDVAAIVSYFAATNLTSILDQSTPFGLNVRVPALTGLLGGPIEERTELAKLASPVFHVDADDPPLLLLHGDQDPQMPINQSHELHGVYKAKGLDVAFEVVHGARHGGSQFFDAERTALVLEFLDRHLR